MAKSRPPVKLTHAGLTDWRLSQLPDLTGRSYIITGGNSGIGFEAARMLGEAGGDIVIACRNLDKAKAAERELENSVKGSVSSVQLDLADLSSVRAAASELTDRMPRIDALINNAGIMQTPPLKTADGFEMQIGTNHLGHFLLSGLLFERIEASAGRIVSVASLAHKYGRIHLDDLMLENDYTPTRAYCQSKLANLMSAIELQRRLSARGAKTMSIACHPGYSGTQLQSTGPTGWLNAIYKLTNALLAQPARAGALPTVLAAAGDEALAGGYYGPQGFRELRGKVGEATVARRALDEAVAAELWRRSEALTGFSWAFKGAG
ncbi:MAG: oxidoreductase [Pseudomonadota bacterium]